MTDPAAARATQLRNIEASTGRTIDHWSALTKDSGFVKHGEIVAWLKSTHGLTHGNANALAHAVRARDAGASSPHQLLDSQYSNAKQALRPILDAVVDLANGLGDDVTVTVQKSAVSLRRGRQFAMVEAPAAARVRIGFNLKGAPATSRVKATTGMCTHSVDVTKVDDLDDEITRWMRDAYHAQDRRSS